MLRIIHNYCAAYSFRAIVPTSLSLLPAEPERRALLRVPIRSGPDTVTTWTLHYVVPDEAVWFALQIPFFFHGCFFSG